MTFSPPNTLESSLPENINFAYDWDQYLEQWTNLYRKVAIKVNGKERAIYPLELEILNDQRFFTVGDTRSYRSVFRKVFHFGAVAAGVTLVIPHLITGMTEFTHIYGTATTAVPDYRPLPYVSVIAVNQGTQLVVGAANINIVNGAAATPLVSGIIVLEYVKS